MQPDFRLIKRHRYYYIGYLSADGKRRWKTTKRTTQSEALKALKQFELPNGKAPQPLLLTDLLKAFLNHKGNLLRTHTLKDYVQYVNEFITVVGNKQIQQYTQSDVESFRASMSQRGLANTTNNIRFRSVQAVFGYALQHDYITRSPFRHLKQISVPQRSPVFLTKEQFRELAGAADDERLKELILFALLTGLRLAEITNLRWDSVDFDRRQITVRNTDDFTTKSGRQRTVPMHDEVVALLRRVEPNRQKSIYVFCKRSGYRFSNSFVSHQFKRYCQIAGLPAAIHFHSLRHTFASWCVQSGVDIYVVKELLGHSSVQTTEIYSHVSPSKLHDSIGRLRLS